MMTCRRCYILSPAVREAKPGLALCPACPLLPDCGEWQHDYRGHGVQGTAWTCINCGESLDSIAISLPSPES